MAPTSDQTKEEFKAASTAWREQAEQLEGARPAPTWMTETEGGIPVASAYHPQAPSEDGERPAEFPGQAPFSRGGYPTGHRNVLWQTQQVVGFGTAEDTRERLLYLIRQGQTGHRGAVMNVVFDQPTLGGLDSDHKLSRGGVGVGGVAIDSLGDMADMIEPFDPADSFLSLVVTGMGPVMFSLYAQACVDRGVPLDQISGVMLNDPLTAYYGARTYLFPPRPSLRLVGDVVEFCSEQAPKWNTNGISGYHCREAGATAAMEIGFTVACGLAYVQECVGRGLDPNEFAARFSFFLEVNNDLFEEVAKLRAFRRVWSNELQKRFGVTDPRALLMRCHVQTAGSSCTAQEPYNNIVRTTIQALAAVLGGTNSLHTNSMDEALAIPTEESARIALRTQQIIARESGVGRVADPLGGSYFVEALTDELEAAGVRYIEEIESKGDDILEGVVNSLESGYFHGAIREEAWRIQQMIETGERPIVAVNCFNEDGDTGIDIELFEGDPTFERKQLDRLGRWREQRDGEAVAAALAAIDAASTGTENMIPLLMKAAKAGATVGEMVGTLREQWGSYEEPQPLAA